MTTDPSVFEELRSIQRRFGYIPAAELEPLANRTRIPLYHLHGLASFYPHFRLTPPAKVEVKVCADMSCHLRGACELRTRLEQYSRRLSDNEISIGEVSCLGRCDAAPALTINDQIYSRVTHDQAEAMVGQALAGNAPPHEHEPSRPVRVACDPYRDGERYGVLKRLIHSRDWDGLLAALKASDLRGLGGAGFPTGLKWEFVRKAKGAEKYIVCNADESEPGTIKDRFIMEYVPHLMIEGMIIAGLVTGASKGIIYIRHEYETQEKILEEEIRRCRQERIVGPGLLGSDLTFALDVFVSPGGYICGEESALLEALEGKRAEPRNKPPFPVTHGLWNKPTVINNVETFAQVPVILAKGADWYRAQGRGESSGLKFIGVSGHVRNPGVFEVPMGTPYSELVFEHAGGVRDGKQLKAFAPSGPSSGYLPASKLDVPIDFKAVQQVGSMLGSGAVVVCDEDTCMLDMALNAVKFFRNESCGKCVPCRVGSQKMVDLLTGWTEGRSAPDDFQLIDDLSETLRLTSICGLGQVVPAPIASVLEHFREEVEGHILRKKCPSGVCFDGARRTP